MVSVLKETVLFEYSTDLLPNFLPADAVIIGGLLAVVGVYCSLSGMWGVAITDFVQFFAAMLGCVLLAVFAVQHVGGIDALQTSVVSQFEDGQQAFSFLPVGNWMPLHIFCIFLFVQWWATWYPGAEPGGGGYVVQRMAACKDEKHAVFATLWYQIAHYCIRPWPWLMVAFVSIALFPEIRELATNEAFSKAQNKTADVGYAYVMRGEWNPNGLRGLMLVTFFAAFMSTISTQMNWGASYLVRDVYQRFINPHAEEKKLTQVSRWVSLFVLVVGGFVSGWMIASNQSIDDAWKLLLALGAGTGAVYMLRWFWWRINAWSEISAMVGSLVYFVLINQFCFRLDADGNKVAMFSGEETMLCVALLTIGTWLMVTFLTAPERQETLESFYRKVKPGGFGWQPIARLAPEVAVDRNLVLSIVTAVVASGIVFFTLPAIGCFIFGRFGDGIGLGMGALACAAVVVAMTKKLGAESLLR